MTTTSERKPTVASRDVVERPTVAVSVTLRRRRKGEKGSTDFRVFNFLRFRDECLKLVKFVYSKTPLALAVSRLKIATHNDVFKPYNRHR